MHRLNKCNAAMARITKRHNSIARIISDEIRNMRGFDCPPLNENSTIYIRDHDQLPDRSKNLKPDIWYIDENAHTSKKTINVIEITCPYGMLTDTANGRRSTLIVREEEKLNKYNTLISDIKATWNVDANLFVIVISSLGVITKNTKATLKKLFHSKKRRNLIAKRCIIAAIRGSWAVFYGKDIDHSNYVHRPVNSSVDTEQSSSSHLTDEEDGDILNDDNLL